MECREFKLGLVCGGNVFKLARKFMMNFRLAEQFRNQQTDRYQNVKLDLDE